MNRYSSEAELCAHFSLEGDAGGGGIFPLMASVLVIILALTTSCSFKSKDEQQAQVQSHSGILELPQIADADRDGLSDNVENALGRDSLTGNFPVFGVEDFSETSIEITDFTNPENKHKATYKIDKSIGSDLSFTPLSDKLAKHAYTRTVGQAERPEAVDVYDLNILKLSNFLYVDTLKIRNFIKENEDNLDSTSVRIQSRFYIRASNILGLTKINNIKAEVGFLDIDGGFSSFGSVFDLMTTSNTRLIFSSRGDSDSSKSNMEALIYIDRLSIDTISYILENDLQLAIKISDYSATVVDGSSFKFSSQVQEALSTGTLYSISTPSKDYLFFNARQESIGRMLDRLFGAIETDGEGTLLRTQRYENNSSYPIRYEELGNEHLREKSWHLFSSNDKTTDVPGVGEAVMLGFFLNSYIAKMGGRVIRLDGQEHKSKAIEHQINTLNVGETIEIGLAGLDRYPTGTAPREISSEAVVDVCQCSGRLCMKSENKCRQWGSMNGWCGHGWIDLINNEVPLLDSNKLNQIHFTSEKIKNPISLSNIIFFKKQIPIRDLTSGEWFIKIVIDEEFLNEFGNSISLHAPTIVRPQVRYGFNGFGNCGHRSLGKNFRFVNPSRGQAHHTDGSPTHEYKINIKRAFAR